MTKSSIVALLLLGASLPAQQIRWQVPSPPSTDTYLQMYSFADYDLDGYRDVLSLVYDNAPGPLSFLSRLQIRSGVDGSVLHELVEIRLANVAHAGDMDEDGRPDVAVLWDWGTNTNEIFLRSPATGQTLWSVTGLFSEGFGDRMLGGLDVNRDGRSDLVVSSRSVISSKLFVYDHTGSLLWTKDMLALGRLVISMAKMGDMDGDGCDDFVVGSNDSTGRGALDLVSGKNGNILRTSFGLVPGDRLSAHVGNIGDIDGDGIHDFVAFPYWSSTGMNVVAYSGATGAVIRTWFEYGNSAVVGDDHDQDGVGDLVVGADWPTAPPNAYGSTPCYSGRDGTLLWKVDNFLPPPNTGSNGTSGWMEYSANLGVQPGSPYPVVAWLDTLWWTIGTYHGRIRAYEGTRAGQGPVTGTACTSRGTLPLIGTRATTTGSRITVAKSHPNALAVLWLGISPLPQPVDLSPFGLGGCNLYVAADATFLRTLGTTGLDKGYAAVDLGYQLAQAGVGLAAVAQWLVYDFATGDHATTQLHGIRLQ